MIKRIIHEVNGCKEMKSFDADRLVVTLKAEDYVEKTNPPMRRVYCRSGM